MAHEPNKEEQKVVSVSRGMDKENVVQDFPRGLVAKNPMPMQDTQVRSPVQEDTTCHG